MDATPAAARRYRDAIIANGRLVWGMGGPIPMFGAQIEQESGWREDARSPVGATGLAQFMPKTADWIDDVYPDLGPNQPLNPEWAIRALIRYDKHLYDRVASSVSDCDRHAFALSGYNGGEGWRIRDQKKAAETGLNPEAYWDSVEKVNAGRAPQFWSENRGYPRRILIALQPKYGLWGRVVCKELHGVG
jgi:soluble lytic murein transglycosylase-like protein